MSVPSPFPLIRLGFSCVGPGLAAAALEGNGYLSLEGPSFLNLPKLSEKAKRLMKGKNFAFVATLNKDGTPQLTPTWVDTDGKNVLINTTLGRQKNKNVTRDPRITVGVFNHADPYEYVSVSGKVVRKVTGKAARDHIDMLSMKYRGEPKYHAYGPDDSNRVILVIRPSKSA